MSYSIFRDEHGLWCWHLLGPDNVQIALAGTRYETQHECLAAVAQVKQSVDSRITVTEKQPVRIGARALDGSGEAPLAR